MAKKKLENYPLGIANPMPVKIINQRVETMDHPGVVIGHKHNFSVPSTEKYRKKNPRENSVIDQMNSTRE